MDIASQIADALAEYSEEVNQKLEDAKALQPMKQSLILKLIVQSADVVSTQKAGERKKTVLVMWFITLRTTA